MFKNYLLHWGFFLAATAIIGEGCNLSIRAPSAHDHNFPSSATPTPTPTPTPSTLEFAFTTNTLTPVQGSATPTFTRADTRPVATFYGSDGKLKFAPHNHVTQSEALDHASWTLGPGTSITPNTTLAPDGSLSADTITLSDPTNYSQIYGSTSGTTWYDSKYTVSAWLKGSGQVRLGANCVVESEQPISLTSSWTRYSATYTTQTGPCSIFPRIILYPGDAAVSLEAWGVQFERNSSASAYLKTTGSARFDGPRFDTHPEYLTARGLQFEESRTNLLLRSEDFLNGDWSKSRSAVTVNAISGPEDAPNADRIEEDSTTGYHQVFQTISKAATSLDYTFSVYAKAGTRKFLLLTVGDNTGSNAINARFNLATGSYLGKTDFGTGFTLLQASSEKAWNGWYRLSLSVSTNSAASLRAYASLMQDATTSIYLGGGAGQYAYLFGAQLEQARFASRYIPTNGATATRSTEQLSISAGSWYSSITSTFLLDFETLPGLEGPGEQIVFGARHSSLSDWIKLGYNSLQQLFTSTQPAGIVSGTVGTTEIADVRFRLRQKLALTQAANDSFLVSGSYVSSVGSNGPTTVDTFDFGSSTLGNSMNGWIRNFLYRASRVSTSTLQTETASGFIELPVHSTGAESIEVFDATGDGHVDLVIGGGTNDGYASIIPLRPGMQTLPRYTFTTTVGGFVHRTLLYGDWDQDGDLDLIAPVYNHNGLLKYENIAGEYSFISMSDTYTPVTQTSGYRMAVADLNKDGDPDLITGGWGSPLRVLLGSTGTNFAAGVNYGIDARRLNIVTGDFNNDTWQDVLTCNSWDANCTYFENDGTGTLEAGIDFNYSFSAGAIVVGNFNGDANLDWAFLHMPGTELYTDNYTQVGIYLGNGNGTFQARVDYTLNDEGSGESTLSANLATGDFDQDGDLDLASVNGTAPAALNILYNNGSGVFGSRRIVSITGAGQLRDVKAADLNGDGRPEILISDRTQPKIRIYFHE